VERIGERFIPDKSDLKTEAEHLHRYLSISKMVEGKSVVDLGCGHGYGSQILKNYSTYVGIDIDHEVISGNASRFLDPSIAFLAESADRTSIESNSVDVVVCFEMIEHVVTPVDVIAEAKRILKPNGILFSSTPDKSNYNLSRMIPNEFHLHELEKSEFSDCLDNFFVNTRFYGQSYIAASFLMAELNPNNDATIIRAEDVHSALHNLSTYWVAVSSDSTNPTLENSIFVGKLDRNYDEEIARANKQLGVYESELEKRTHEMVAALDNAASLGNDLSAALESVSNLSRKVSDLESLLVELNTRLTVETRVKEAYKKQIFLLIVQSSLFFHFLRKVKSVITLTLNRR
jgi:ubiquinone/menaquinone biosynthesis C-methylase UbiE